jgi:uncharacterized protein (DUF1778 family)
MSLRIRAEEKAILLRAVALKHTDLTDFVIRHAVRAAKAIIEEADRVQLSERDSLRVLALLENPPEPNARLLAAAQAVPRRA